MRAIVPRLLLFLAVGTLSLSYIVICVHFQTAWPWNVVVHEDGRRTLTDTVLYLEHALGELPLEILISATVAGSFLWLCGPAERMSIPVFAGAALLLDLGILLGAFVRAGTRTSLDFLLQYHTRDGESLVYGSHWRYHLLSQVALMVLATGLASVVCRTGRSGSRSLLIGAWAVYGILTLVFGVSGAAFRDPRYLGHQARELFTLTLVAVPLATACCAACVPHCEPGTSAGFAIGRTTLICGTLFLLVTAYLGVAVLLTRSQQVAQTGDWVRIVCSHFFEHSAGDLAAPLHAVLFYQWASVRSAKVLA